jgi:putative ABC transport system permease protein
VKALLLSIGQDLRFAVRNLDKNRGFTLLAVLALSLGIGSVTTIFSAVYGVLIHTFPYPHSERLVNFEIQPIAGSTGGRGVLSIPEFLDYREQNNVFVDMIGGDTIVLHSRYGNQTVQWNVSRSSPNEWKLLGARPLLGRLITPDDTRAGQSPVFMMAYSVWKSQFNSDPGVLGKTFDLNGVPYRLIAVLGPRFRPGNGTDAFIGFPMDRATVANDPTLKDVRVWPLGMLKPGVTVQQAAADLDLIAHHRAKSYPREYPEQFQVSAVPLLELVLPRFRQMLYPLLGAVLLLLLIACVNVANLQLSRATSRDREIAVRASLGATRWRLIRQLLVESFVLAGAGCAAGCIIAWLGIRELVPLIPQRAVPDESIIELNWIVLVAAIAVAVLATLLCGLAPAIQTVGGPLYPRLSSSGGSSGGLRNARFRSALIVIEVGLSVVLLTGAGLMFRTFFGMSHQKLGFDPKSVLSFDMGFPTGRYDTPLQRQAFFDELLPRVRRIPGVLDAAEALSPSPIPDSYSPIDVLGSVHSEPWQSSINAVGGDFFQIFGYRLLRGRLLTADDLNARRPVVVVNQAFAKKFLSKGDPLGANVDFVAYDEVQQQQSNTAPPTTTAKKPPTKSYFEVVGILSDVNADITGTEPVPEAFLPSTLLEQFVGGLTVRTAGNAEQFNGPVVQQIWAMNHDIDIGQDHGSVYDVFQKYIYAQPRFEFVMLSTFAGVGLLLVVIGIYSVTAYNVSLRTHEIGIRMALGAQPGDVLRAVLRQSAIIIGMGLVLGLFGGWGTTRLIQNQLWNVKPMDPWTFAVVIAVVFAIGMVACFFPARSASHADPRTALRHE